MAIQLRETQFAWVVRLLSGRKLFRYPDEVDDSLSTRYRAQQAQPEGEVDQERGNGNDNEKSAERDDNDIYVVDWYGPQDPEVCVKLRQAGRLTDIRTPRIGHPDGSSSLLSRYAS